MAERATSLYTFARILWEMLAILPRKQSRLRSTK
jgi:hypothetical protein